MVVWDFICNSAHAEHRLESRFTINCIYSQDIRRKLEGLMIIAILIFGGLGILILTPFVSGFMGGVTGKPDLTA